jgi:hypothetical protein
LPHSGWFFFNQFTHWHANGLWENSREKTRNSYLPIL